MSDYDSGDELLGSINVDTLISGMKRSRSPDDEQSVRETKLAKHSEVQDHEYIGNISKKILKDDFGYDDFRHEQFSAIKNILQGENVLVVFPTGAGKSLCYQIPAVAFEKIDALRNDRHDLGPGITIVVSPLIALMKDQVDALLRRRISAACLDSTKTYEQNQQINTDLREGRLRLLYCAPERLNNEGFVENMKHVSGGVRLVAVDEAHCISEWGHSFRPDYLKVARFVDEIKAEKVICLTATATPRVAEDVAKAFHIKQSNIFRSSPYRPNLQLLAESVPTKQDKYPKMFQFLRNHPGPTLVYVTLQKQAELLADDLKDQGFDAVAFHAGLKTEAKTLIQDDFMANKVTIVVATIAFGMGIDKPDIRNILHFDLSGTVEEYSQQIGRAGRDGKISHCMFYICPDDFYIRENFARGDLPSRQSLRQLLHHLFHMETTQAAEGEVIKLNQTALGREYDMRASPLAILLATLELHFGLLRAITPEYGSYQFEAMSTYYHIAHADKSQEGKAIFKHAIKAKKWYNLDINFVVSSSGLLRADLVRKLNEYHDKGIIMLKVGGVENRYKVLKKLPNTPYQIDAITDKLFVDMETREEEALKRTQQVIDLITGDKCFALALAEHFGMGLPDEKTKCGHCTHCFTGKRVILPPRPSLPADMDTIRRVLAACRVRDDPRFLARVAFGIKSPRVLQLKLHQKEIFGSLVEHDFKVPIINEPILSNGLTNALWYSLC
ncbi:ATP-dependent DNA helicase [Annulohypoxylon maeteangense]|uniref:ATP-dependent DNA helicase n=1 Tax=Annulohypoxylon maeteangense TaxID=1927788 RepID=UPI002008428B|nr:ATP-dependent DNA helicase [Annulohypoxylon maeteangense]KAI0887710.1 ATP-dependent DNA helicase [Annulohypoxylon maeteangense]